MRYQTILLILLLLATVFQTACSQSYQTRKTVEGKAKRLYQRAIQYQKEGMYEKAVKDLNTVIGSNPQFIDAYLRLANIQLGQKEWRQAGRNLEKVVELDSIYEFRSYYYLGLCHWEQDDFEAAIPYFSHFLRVYSSEQGTLEKKAQTYLRNSQFAAKAINDPVPFDPLPLGAAINTTNPEYLPSITADGQTLIFTRRIRGQEDVYESQLEGGQWQTATPLTGINTPEANEGSQYISADGRLIVFVKCSDRDGYGGCDLYFSEKKKGYWTKPENMGQPINTSGWESQPSLSADGKLLYFASNRIGGQGGRDIWLTYRRKDGNWAKPINLGAAINTPDNDESPFFHPDGNTLYFMSNGHPGMGGYDLLVSRRGEDGAWKKPDNLGYPINTKGNEGALFITLDGQTAYFAKDGLKLMENPNPALSGKQPDIFTFTLPIAARANLVNYVKASVKDASTKEVIGEAKVELIELKSGTLLSAAETNAEGSFLTCLPLGNDYALNINKPGYLFHSENFSLTEASTLKEPYQLYISLYPIPEKTTSLDKTKPVILKNVFFESGSAELKVASVAELEQLKKLLEEHPHLKIQINGHTDNIGTEADNSLLSEQRAKAVQDYLIERGIAASRLRYKGYGESQPIDSNNTESGRKNNRRTTFVLVD